MTKTNKSHTSFCRFTVSNEVEFPFRAIVLYPEKERGGEVPIAFCTEVEEAERIADALNNVIEAY